MTNPNHRLKHGCAIAVVGALVAWLLLSWAAECWWRSRNEPTFSQAVAIKPGMSEGEVLERLGEPWHVYEAGSAPEDYYVDGYEYRRRSISNRVLIYLYGELIVYVYIDKDGKVEYRFIGGS